jgi:hypothetical protein
MALDMMQEFREGCGCFIPIVLSANGEFAGVSGHFGITIKKQT